MNVSLPEVFRPRGVRYRKVQPGIDFPSSFYDELKSIDSDLWLVYHKYLINYEGIIQNDYVGSWENPRHTINVTHGELCFGTVCNDPVTKEPVPDGRWHIWRLNHSHGWSHVVPVDGSDSEYLQLLTERLYLQDQVTTRYGYRAYRKQQEATREARREKEQELESEKMTAWQGENTDLLSNAKDNLSRGNIAPTNPTRETIASFPGQTHRSTLKRPLEDSDVLKGPGGEKY